MRRIGSAVIACVILAACAGLEAPKPASHSHPCTNPAESITPTTRIAACTQLLETARLTATERSNVLNNRGLAYVATGADDKAVDDFDQAIRLYPQNAPAYVGRGNVYSARKQYDRAIVDYDEAVKLDPQFALAFHDRGLTHQAMGEPKKALDDFKKAGALDPNNAMVANDIAWILATSPDSAIRNGAKAVKWATRAVSLADNPGYHDTLAAAFAESGRFEEAVLQQELAIQELEAHRMSGRRSAYEARLALYKSGKPYRS